MPQAPEQDPHPTRHLPRRARLADWIDLLAVERRDEGRAASALRRRDREIGAALPGDAPARARLLAWLDAVREREQATGEPLPGARAAEALRLGALALALTGAALGVSAALGALSFQPRGRINLTLALIVLLGVPTLFLLLALLNALPAAVRRVLPWLGREPEGGGVLQPARLVLRAVPQRWRTALEEALGRGRGIAHLAAPIRRWLVLAISQRAALAFQLGALAATGVLVVVSDLSFGWSTTLRIETEAFHRFVHALAVPFAWLWPAASPSAELVEQTRFFRIAAEPGPDVSPARYGDWWPFLVMCLAVYGALPRLLFLALARLRLARGLAEAVLAAPVARVALARMEAPLLESGAEVPENGDERAAAAEAAPGAPLPARAVVVSWAEAIAADDPADVTVFERFEAGGRQSLEDDVRVAWRAASEAKRNELPVLVAVRGFEPPLAEAIDFLRALRSAAGDATPILVLARGGTRAQREAWRRRLAAVGDPWLALVVEAAP